MTCSVTYSLRNPYPRVSPPRFLRNCCSPWETYVLAFKELFHSSVRNHLLLFTYLYHCSVFTSRVKLIIQPDRHPSFCPSSLTVLFSILVSPLSPPLSSLPNYFHCSLLLSFLSLTCTSLPTQEFEYWYPFDLRVSAKDLIPNHLTMSLYNHVEIWKDRPEMWPKGIYCNGHIMVDAEKMVSLEEKKREGWVDGWHL